MTFYCETTHTDNAGETRDGFDKLKWEAIEACEKAEKLRHGHYNMSDATDLIDQQAETILDLIKQLETRAPQPEKAGERLDG